MLKSNEKPCNIDYIFQYESKQARKQEIMKENYDIKLLDLQSLNHFMCNAYLLRVKYTMLNVTSPISWFMYHMSDLKIY